MAREFTQQLQDLLLNQTSLDLVNSGGDLTYEGEITEYYIAPLQQPHKTQPQKTD